ncbi:hypothetical protein C3942_05780 [Solimonas fluminis]|uniref:SH3b domain-containing protein n=1 Tax=Solimonas fluminis TaxID=2086571 RepID=A0A2S5TJN2_9GAMM|nr:SH3 domain-containing protein [Solimonas fluminis]PPE75183.1 hypothetical protein C3942_05780 [Solimonas fluminis]
MAMLFAIATVVAAALLVALLWREIGGIRDEFFQKVRSRLLQRLGIVATAASIAAAGVIATQAVLLDRQAASHRAAEAELAGLKLDLARLQRLALRAARTAHKPAQDLAQATAEPAAPRRAPHAYVAASSAVVRNSPGQHRLFTLQRGTEVKLLGDAQEIDGRAWQEIAIGDGRQGWIAASLLEPAT